MQIFESRIVNIKFQYRKSKVPPTASWVKVLARAPVPPPPLATGLIIQGRLHDLGQGEGVNYKYSPLVRIPPPDNYSLPLYIPPVLQRKVQ